MDRQETLCPTSDDTKFTAEVLAHTVVVIEHNLDVIRTADRLIDLGPGPGRHGGQVLYSGPVAELGETATGRALRAWDYFGG